MDFQTEIATLERRLAAATQADGITVERELLTEMIRRSRAYDTLCGAYDLTLTLIGAIREVDWGWAPRNSRAGELIPATCDEVETALRAALAVTRDDDATEREKRGHLQSYIDVH